MDTEKNFELGLTGSGVDGTISVSPALRITAADLSRVLGIETSDVARLARQNVIERTERGTYALEKSVRGYVAYLRAKMRDRPRDRLDSIKAETAAVELECTLGSLIELSAAERAVAESITAARRYFEGIPARLSSILAEKTNPHEIFTLLENEINTALESLADTTFPAAAQNANPLGERGEIPPDDDGELPPDTPPLGERLG